MVKVWSTTLAVVGAGVVASLQIGKGAVAGPLLRADLGIDLEAVGWLTSVFAILGMMGGVAAGAVVAGVGDRRMLCLGLGATALGAALGAEAGTFFLLLAGRVIEGLGFLLITIAGPAILQRLVPEARRDLAFSLWSCFMPAGMAIAMLVGPAFGDWRTMWWSSSILSIATIAGMLLLIPRQGDGRSAPSRQGLGADVAMTLQAQGPPLLAAGFVLYNLMFFALFSFLPLLLMDRMQVSLPVAGVLSAVAVAANMLGNLAAGALLSRGASRSALVAIASIVMGIAGLGIFLPILPDIPTFLLCVVFSAVGGITPATLLSSAPVVAPSPKLAPIAVGLAMQGSGLGQVIGPVAVGRAIETFGWPSAAIIVALAALLSVGLTRSLRRTLHARTFPAISGP